MTEEEVKALLEEFFGWWDNEGSSRLSMIDIMTIVPPHLQIVAFAYWEHVLIHGVPGAEEPRGILNAEEES
jgi:hypothetical protein